MTGYRETDKAGNVRQIVTLKVGDGTQTFRVTKVQAGLGIVFAKDAEGDWVITLETQCETANGALYLKGCAPVDVAKFGKPLYEWAKTAKLGAEKASAALDKMAQWASTELGLAAKVTESEDFRKLMRKVHTKVQADSIEF